ncbi:MAG: hypothetical protein KAS72_01975 [Phycisphaerales bacterium]|nr:hypothetical protein [Phycisphaerales bacterium]
MTDPPARTAGSEGLAGVQAGRSEIASVRQDRLLYRGYEIADLIEHATYSEVAHLLLVGHKPSRDELNDFRQELASLRPIPDGLKALLRDIAAVGEPIDVLRTAVSYLGLSDPDVGSRDGDAELRIAKRLLARVPTIIGYTRMLRDGIDPVEPDPALDHPANLLWCMTGQQPSDLFARVIDISLILFAEHGYDASSFASRVIAATLSDSYSAVCGAIGALKGSLDGGATAATMDMLREIGSPDNVQPFVDQCFQTKRKVMGFGHRVYEHDHRVPLLLGWGKRIAEQVGPDAMKWFEIGEHVGRIMLEEKGLHPNAEFAFGLTYFVMGIPASQYTTILASAHVAGWCAHIMEQHAHNRLIRPLGDYVGPPRRSWATD